MKARVAEGWSYHEVLADFGREFLDYPMTSRERTLLRDRFRRGLARYMENPRRFDPDVDEMAVERAFMGDADVWVNLSIRERQACVDKLVAVWEGNKPHPAFPADNNRMGIIKWSDAVGEPHDRISNIYQKRLPRG